MDLSYTQNMEDTHLWLAFGGKRTGTYLDIGAGHPIADNVSFFFYERGWRGVAGVPAGSPPASRGRSSSISTHGCGRVMPQSPPSSARRAAKPTSMCSTPSTAS